jgi:hypothetical protein
MISVAIPALYQSNIAFYDPKRKTVLKKGSSRPCGVNSRSISIHAEENAIKFCRRNNVNKRCDIYIWRWGKDGKIKPAKCCNACTKIANKYHFNDRIFTFENNDICSAFVENPCVSLGFIIRHGL